MNSSPRARERATAAALTPADEPTGARADLRLVDATAVPVRSYTGARPPIENEIDSLNAIRVLLGRSGASETDESDDYDPVFDDDLQSAMAAIGWCPTATRRAVQLCMVATDDAAGYAGVDLPWEHFYDDDCVLRPADDRPIAPVYSVEDL